MKFTPDQKLMALSWKQPFASAMLCGKIETRTWDAKYRGWVLICSSKKPYNEDAVHDICGYTQHFNLMQELARKPDGIESNGYAIAIGKLVDSRPMKREDEEKCFVEYWPDLYCHVYEDVQAIVPFQWKGTQGWKEVSQEIKNSITFII
jgi:hypothetical protein